MPRKRNRPTRKRVPGEKGSAERGLEIMRQALTEMKQLQPSETGGFVRKFNEFVHYARAIPKYLQNEKGHFSGFDAWISSEIETLENDARFHFLVDLRNAALKDFPIEPNKGDVTIEIGGVSAHAAAGLPALMDCASLEGIPPCDNSTPARAAIRYFLDHSPWPEEDMVQFAEKVFEKLKALVDGARPR